MSYEALGDSTSDNTREKNQREKQQHQQQNGDHRNQSRRPKQGADASPRSLVTAASSSSKQQRNYYHHNRTGSRSSSLSEPLTQSSELEMEMVGEYERRQQQQNGDHHGVADDPFYMFREDLYRKLEQVDEGLAEYLRIVHQTDTAVNNHELKDAKKQLRRRMKHAESTLKDVQTTVQLVADCDENDRREKFAHITDKELYERKSLVLTSKDRLGRARQEMSSEAVKAKLLSDERSKALRRAAGNGDMGARTDAERDNTSFIVDSQARTSLLMQHQDETLDELDAAVSRVGVMAENIHGEIGQQNKMLTEMSDDLADAEEQLGMVMGKLAKFLKTKDRWQLGTILALFLTMIVLLFLVIYV